MLVVIDHEQEFDFKREAYGHSVKNMDWFATWNLNGLELEVCFSEDIFYKRTGTSDDIDWEHIKNTIAKFLSKRQGILDKAQEALLALNKLIGAWTEETMALGFYDLVCIQILQWGFELQYKLIGYTNEHYFIDAPTATWYVTFAPEYLQGVRRIVY